MLQMLKSFLCTHSPRKYLLGSFKCEKCGQKGADLGDFDSGYNGYVNPLRKLFTRDPHTITRTRHFDPTRRGH